jgi:hypothetical protein
MTLMKASSKRRICKDQRSPTIEGIGQLSISTCSRQAICQMQIYMLGTEHGKVRQGQAKHPFALV